MADIDYPRFYRVLTRCQSLAEASTATDNVKKGWELVLSPLASAYRAAHDALSPAEEKAKKETGEELVALGKIDQPFREARAVVLMHRPYAQVPDTLKAQPTDTDKLNAIQALLHTIEEAHASHEAWADPLVAGAFFTLAPDVIRETTEAIAASKDLGHAVSARSSAYQPAYDAYLRFKTVVRETFGHASKEYRDIHVRARHASDTAEAPPVGGAAGPAPTTPATS